MQNKDFERTGCVDVGSHSTTCVLEGIVTLWRIPIYEVCADGPGRLEYGKWRGLLTR
jgi:hypothetical protein